MHDFLYHSESQVICCLTKDWAVFPLLLESVVSLASGKALFPWALPDCYMNSNTLKQHTHNLCIKN